METAAAERRGRTGREPGGTPCFWFLNLHRCAGRTPTPTPRTPVTDTQLSQIHRIMVVFGELPCLRSVWEWSAMPHEHEPSLSSRRLSRTHQPPLVRQQPAMRSEFSPPLPPCAHHHRSIATSAYKHPNDLFSGTRSVRPGARIHDGRVSQQANCAEQKVAVREKVGAAEWGVRTCHTLPHCHTHAHRQ